MQGRQQLQIVTRNFNLEDLNNFFRSANESFNPTEDDYSHYADETSPGLQNLTKFGEIEFDDSQRLVVVTAKSERELTSRSGKKRQYDLAKKILKTEFHDAGIFVFYDSAGQFRFSLVVAHYSGIKRSFSNFRRYTYFVSPDLPNKTFLNQIGRADFSSVDKILRAFSIEAVSNDFYNEFKPTFDRIADSVQKAGADLNLKQDFALLFVIRIIFLGFVQKKGWLGKNEHFIQHYWEEYSRQFDGNNDFYLKWLESLFFEALNSPPGRKVKYQNNDFSPETETILQQAPYLNGELFKEKAGVDDRGLWIPDTEIAAFFDFLFQYNFTIEENTLYDEELELNPEFLGIIFERMVNKADGAVYTPRTEVDFMCRIALVKWLEKNSTSDLRDLYYLFFREGGASAEFDEMQKQGDFSPAQIKKLVQLLENVTVCDPAAGSGAFEVGMLHVLNDVLTNLLSRNNTPAELPRKTPFELKKDIIAHSLYGVEVKRWAVWINQLRLWLTLFIDMPDEYRNSLEPLLPSLNFKVRCGDSLVQRIGSKMFPVQEHARLPREIKRRITELKKLKVDFFHNRGKNAKFVRDQENRLFRDILDAEIDEKKKALRGIIAPQPTQSDLGFVKGPSKKDQLRLKTTEENKQRLTGEIAELEEQRRNLKDEHPLIWNIEFAEIFFDGGGFDIIIGNPPYVRQEEITDPNGQLQPKDYKAALQETMRLDSPRHFKPKVKIDGKSDLYTFFYLRSLHLLNTTGVHVFICSNSWLDVGYGVWVQHFLLRNVPMHFIFDNHAKRSFASSDINTIISVFDAPEKRLNPTKSSVKFVAFKQPFEEVILTENLLDIENARSVAKNEAYRVYPIEFEKLLQEGSEFESEEQEKLGIGKYIGDKWGGKYLRAPDVFFTIIEKGEKHLQRFREYFDGERYLNTGGADGFFIITNYVDEGKYYQIHNSNTQNAQSNFSGKIEGEYLRPLIKDVTKKKKTIEISEADALCFVVNKEPSSLAKKYINWGEVHDYHERSVTKLQSPWYKPTRQMLHSGEVLLPRSFNDTFVIHFNPNKYLSLRFYRLHKKKAKTSQLVAFMNSTLFWLVFETLGNKNLGQGALDFFMAPFLTMRIPIILCKKLELFFSQMNNRVIKSIFTECGIDPKSDISIAEQEPNPLPDRAALDKVVFDALDLTEEERKEVYRAVCQLVWNRLSKAKSV